LLNLNGGFFYADKEGKIMNLVDVRDIFYATCVRAVCRLKNKRILRRRSKCAVGINKILRREI